jgi:hypothetical protein
MVILDTIGVILLVYAAIFLLVASIVRQMKHNRGDREMERQRRELGITDLEWKKMKKDIHKEGKELMERLKREEWERGGRG